MWGKHYVRQAFWLQEYWKVQEKSAAYAPLCTTQIERDMNTQIDIYLGSLLIKPGPC